MFLGPGSWGQRVLGLSLALFAVLWLLFVLSAQGRGSWTLTLDQELVFEFAFDPKETSAKRGMVVE